MPEVATSIASGSPLTAALLAPLPVDHRAITGADVAHASDTLRTSATRRPGGGPFRITDYVVRSTLWPPDDPRPESPFAWSAPTARRLLGLAAVRAVVGGRVASPVDGVTMIIEQGIEAVRRGDRSASSMDRWLSHLSAAGRAAVQADAVTWASRLHTGLDWPAFAAPPTIGRDYWWDSPDSSLLALRSRAEVRTITTGRGGQPVSAHLVVVGGPRRPTVRAELSVVALVEALRSGPGGVPPGRIVGWWPDSGRFVAVDVEPVTLDQGAAMVARTLASLSASRPDQGGAAGAAA
jgi:hypothetical protein